MAHFSQQNMNLSKIKTLFSKLNQSISKWNLHTLKRTMLFLLVLLTFWISFATLRFFVFDQAFTNIDQALEDKNHLVIIYKPECSRCKKVLPWLFLKNAFSLKREYVINSHAMTQEQKDKSEAEILPSFLWNGDVYDTVDQDLINKLWSKSH